MYFKPPQNNLTNPFYHPMNQKLNEERQFKARIAFMGEPRDNARDMRAAGRMKMYDTATERNVPSKRKSTVFDITFKSERQFNQFMGAYDVEFLDRLDEATKKQNGEKAREVLTSAKVPHSMVMGTIRVPERFVRIAKEKLDDAFGGMFQKKTGFKVSGTMKEDVEIDEAVKTKVEKTSQGFQVMVYSPKVKKFIPQGSPHKTKAAAEKDAKMFEDVEIDESRDDFDDFDVKAAQDDRMYTAKKFIDALKKAGIKHEYVRYSGTMRVVKKDLGKAQGIGKKLKADKVGIRMDILREGLQLDEKKKPISTRLGDAFDSGELEDRIKSMSGPARKSFMNLANSLTDFYHSMGDIHQVDGRQLEDKIDGSPPRVRKMFAKLLDEEVTRLKEPHRVQKKKQTRKAKPIKDDVQLDEVTGETRVMAKGDRNHFERITRALGHASANGKIDGYEGAHINEPKGIITLIFDTKAHKPRGQRQMLAKMLKTYGLKFDHSIEEGFASDAQRRAAFASGYKAKGKKKKEGEEVDEADINLPNKPKNAIRKPKIDSKPTMKKGLRQAMSGSRETPAQKQKRQEKDNFDLYKKRQKRIAALRGDKSSRELTPKQQRDYLRRVNLDQIRAMEEVEIDEEKGTYSSMSRRGIEKPLMGFIADLEDELKKVGLKYSDRKVDPDDVMKAYNANMSPKDAAAMIKKKVK